MNKNIYDYTFGIEIEMKGMSKEQIKDAFLKIKVPCHDENESGGDNSWFITVDGSVAGGYEVVSPILRGEKSFHQVQKVMNILEENGGYSDKQCGFHVHVGTANQDISSAAMKRVIANYAKHEDVIDSFMPFSRRGNSNNYCWSMRNISDDVNNANGSPHDIANAVTERFYKVNLQAFLRHGTIEFRQHSGTIEAGKAIPWIEFCINFIDKSIRLNEIDIFDGISDQSKAYFIDRINYFKAKEQEYYANVSKRKVEFANMQKLYDIMNTCTNQVSSNLWKELLRNYNTVMNNIYYEFNKAKSVPDMQNKSKHFNNIQTLFNQLLNNMPNETIKGFIKDHQIIINIELSPFASHLKSNFTKRNLNISEAIHAYICDKITH